MKIENLEEAIKVKNFLASAKNIKKSGFNQKTMTNYKASFSLMAGMNFETHEREILFGEEDFFLFENFIDSLIEYYETKLKKLGVQI